MSEWIRDITYLGTCGWTQTDNGALIPPPGFLLSELDTVITTGSYSVSNLESRKKCIYCGQWGEPRTACNYCGAPIDGDC